MIGKNQTSKGMKLKNGNNKSNFKDFEKNTEANSEQLKN